MLLNYICWFCLVILSYCSETDRPESPQLASYIYRGLTSIEARASDISFYPGRLANVFLGV